MSTHDRLWSCLPYMRPLATIVADTLSWYGVDEHGGRVHDLLGTRCDPYINNVLSGGTYDYQCHSNLTRAVLPFGLNEQDVHDVINLFQVTGLDDQGRYFMNPCPAEAGDYIELFTEQDLLFALSKSACSVVPDTPILVTHILLPLSESMAEKRLRPSTIGTCPGGDLSLWGFGAASEQEMIKCCRPLKVEVFEIQDKNFLAAQGWKPAERSKYAGAHGLGIPIGEERPTSQ